MALCLGCGEAPDDARLLLHCGAGIRPAAAELAEEFGRQQGVTVECNYAGSEVLLGRIKLSGLGDLYMPGDVHYVELAQKEGLCSAPTTGCYFVPVILVQKGNPKNIRSLEDLKKPGIVIGLGNPEMCAIGRKSAKILAKNNIAEEDLDVPYLSETVHALGIQVELGKLDAVIVWDAVAADFAGDTQVVAIPIEQNVISTVALGVLKSSKHPDLAAKFVEFVASESGRKIFQKHHYTVTKPK